MGPLHAPPSLDALPDAAALRVFELLPLHARAALACAGRRWAGVSRVDSLWATLSLAGLPRGLCSAPVLTALLRRAGGRLRSFDGDRLLDRPAGEEEDAGVLTIPYDWRCTAEELLQALQRAPEAAGALRTVRLSRGWRDDYFTNGHEHKWSVDEVAQLRALCPALEGLFCELVVSDVTRLVEAVRLLPTASRVVLKLPQASRQLEGDDDDDDDGDDDDASVLQRARDLNAALEACASVPGRDVVVGLKSRCTHGTASLVAALRPGGSLPRVTHLDVSENVRPEEVVPLANALASADCPLTWLSLRSCKLGLVGARVLAPALAAAERLKILKLMNTGMTPAGVALMLRALASNTSLEELNLQRTAAGGDVPRALAELVREHPRLAYLVLNNNRLGDAGATSLGAALVAAAAARRGGSMRELQVDNAHIGAAGAQALLRAVTCAGAPFNCLILSRNSDLPGTALSPLVAAPALRLHVLDLTECSGLGVAGGEALAKALVSAHLPRLKCLRLDGCSLRNAGVSHIAGALTAPGAASLEVLLLSDNQAGVAAARALGAALGAPGGACALRELSLRNNSLGNEGVMALAAALAVNARLENLELAEVGVRVAGVEALCDALVSNGASALRSLNISSNPGTGGAAAHGLVPLLGRARKTLVYAVIDEPTESHRGVPAEELLRALRAAERERGAAERGECRVFGGGGGGGGADQLFGEDD